MAIDQATRLEALVTHTNVLLSSYPDALVWALDAGGSCTAMPDLVPLHGQRVLGDPASAAAATFDVLPGAAMPIPG
jgi:hypothetical protein